MLPPAVLGPAHAFVLKHATPTNLLPSAIAPFSSIVGTGVNMPSSTLSTIINFSTAFATQVFKPDPEKDNGECRLLGPFAIFVQGALGCLALLALVYKRWRERPQRPLKIWFFDASKQVVGSALVHVVNLLLSMLSSGQLNMKVTANTITGRQSGMLALIRGRDANAQEEFTPNPCSFYLLNLIIDTTIGIPILIILVRILTALFTYTSFGQPPQSIQSGNYGTPPSARWWGKQSFVYFLGLIGMKLCVFVVFLIAPWISRVGDWALRWTEGNEVLQVIFVMLIFPVIMNATQYYVIDSFIKNQKPEHERIPDEDDEIDHVERFREDPSSSSEESEPGDEDEPLTAKNGVSGKTIDAERIENKNRSRNRKDLKTGNTEYDPLFDGESSPTVIGSSSSVEEPLVDTGDRPNEGNGLTK